MLQRVEMERQNRKVQRRNKINSEWLKWLFQRNTMRELFNQFARKKQETHDNIRRMLMAMRVRRQFKRYFKRLGSNI